MFLGSPSRVIGIFPTDNKYEKSHVIARWKFISNEFQKYGYKCRFATDADPRLLGAMKILCEFATKQNVPGMCIPLIVNKDSVFKFMSDIFHLLNNFKNRINDPTNSLMFGKYFVSINFLKILLDHPEISRLDHGLSKNDVGTYDSSKDKMSTESTRKICETKVIHLLKKIPGAEGTAIYLQLMRDLYEAFINPELEDLERLKKSFRVLCVIRIWRKNTPKGKRNNFITNVNWACLEMNVTFLLDLILHGKGKLITIWNSQPCEETFRTLRSMGTFGLTQINFSVLEAIEKLSRVNKIHEICSKYKKTFNFPEYKSMRSDKNDDKNEDDSNNSIESIDLSIVRVEPHDEKKCFKIIAEALKEAKNICKNAGMNTLEPCDPKDFFKIPEDEKRKKNHSENLEENDDQENREQDNQEVENEEDDEEQNLNVYLNQAYGTNEEETDENFDFLDDVTDQSVEKNIFKFKNLFFVNSESGNFIYV